MTFKASEAVFCVEYFYAKQGFRDELLESLLALVEPTKAEHGCLQYDLMVDSKDPNLIILVVKFSSQETMTLHEHNSHITSFVENDGMMLKKLLKGNVYDVR